MRLEFLRTARKSVLNRVLGVRNSRRKKVRRTAAAARKLKLTRLNNLRFLILIKQSVNRSYGVYQIGDE